MERKRKSAKVYTGVALDPEVVAFLAALTGETRLSRSFLINSIVRTHALYGREARTSVTDPAGSITSLIPRA